MKNPKVELVTLREAAPLKEIDTLTFGAWGRDLTFQQYRAREMIQRETAHCRRAFRTWGAVIGDDRVASCETFALPFVYRGLRYVAWTIANMFVPEPLRGRGYATALLKELIARGRTERISMLVLHANDSTRMYEKLGFIPRPNYIARRTTPKEFVQWPAGVVPVDERSPLSQRSGNDIAFVVDEAITFWHRSPAHLYARAWDQRDIDISGARLRGSHVLWTPEWRDSLLRLLYRSPAPPEVGPRLMTAALVHAQRFSLAKVEWWTTTPDLAAEPFADVIVPNPHMPLAMSLDAEIPVEAFTPHDRVLWA